MLRASVIILGLLSISIAKPNFLSNFIEDDDDDNDIGVMEYLNGFGDKLFKQPDKKSGEAVSKWSEKSKLNPEELGTYAEGDILFPPGLTKNGLTTKSARWPNGKVPYVFGASFSSKDRAMIEDAIKEYHKNTCVRFVPRSNEKDYVVFKSDPTGCWSPVGRVGGPQDLNLQSPGCLSLKGTVMHEMMHALGFLHEQNRWERDDYVTVVYGNIETGKEGNFAKAQKSDTDGLGIGYDYGSVMHYSANAFSVNGKPTIIPKKQGVSLGQRDNVSHQDIQKIRRMYKCKKSSG